jgi:hypothetical protein
VSDKNGRIPTAGKHAAAEQIDADTNEVQILTRMRKKDDVTHSHRLFLRSN